MKVLLIEDDLDVADTVSSVLMNFFGAVDILHISDGVGFRSGAWQKKRLELGDIGFDDAGDDRI